VPSPLTDRSFADLLDALAAPPPGPASGAGAGLTLAVAAALVTMVARASEQTWEEARGVAAQAGALRTRAVELAALDARAFSEALTALRAGPAVVPGDLGAVMDAAARTVLQIAELAADVAALAAVAALHGEPDVRPDAEVAATLAAACSHAGARLVEANLTVTPGDARLIAARAATAAADADRLRAMGGAIGPTQPT